MTVVTRDELATAIHKLIGKKRMSEAETKSLAEYILNFFGYEEEVIDNFLTSNDRDIFYMLEEVGLLTTREEEVTVRKGKPWRIHYWVLKKNMIKKLAAEPEKPETEGDYLIYKKIYEEVWSQKNKATKTTVE